MKLVELNKESKKYFISIFCSTFHLQAVKYLKSGLF